MKREIKFRGKRIDNGEWAFGNLILDNHPKIKKAFIQVNSEEDLFDRRSYEVIPETVGEFTGLIDKNGEEVYEGDIWQWDEDEDLSYTIDFCEGAFGAYTYGYYRQAGLFKFGEVAGNIHDNPKLIK